METTMNTGEICKDTCCHGVARFSVETRTCTHYSAAAGRSCGRGFVVIRDRHSLSDGPRTCMVCREKPTYRFEVTACDRNSSQRILILDGETMNAGERLSYSNTYAQIRRWIASARAEGCSRFRIEIRRHTARLGWHERRVSIPE